MSFNWKKARETLALHRKDGLRQSELIVELGKPLVHSHLSRLGNEQYDVLEQVAVACLDCGDVLFASECVAKLKGVFGHESARVKKLEAQTLEASGNWSAANLIYSDLIAKDPLNHAAIKRKAAVLKAQNKLLEAIQVLTNHVDKAMTDIEAWLELSDLYLAVGDFQKAAFCVEELILSNPLNSLYHVRYAEIQYTIGGLDNLLLARKHYCAALKHQIHSARALAGLYMTCVALNGDKSAKAKEAPNAELEQLAVSKLKELYTTKGSKAALERLLKTFDEMSL